MIKRILSLFLCFSIMLSMSITCFAAGNTSPWLDSANQTFEPLPSQIILEDYARNMFPTAANAADLFQKWIVDTYGKSTVTDKDPKFLYYKANLVKPYGTVNFLPFSTYDAMTDKIFTSFIKEQSIALTIDLSTYLRESNVGKIVGSVGSYDVKFKSMNGSSAVFVLLFKSTGDESGNTVSVNSFSSEYLFFYSPYLYTNSFGNLCIYSSWFIPSYGSPRFISHETIKSDNYINFMTLDEYNRLRRLDGTPSLKDGTVFGGGKAGRGVGAGRPDSKFRLQDPISKKVIDTDFVNEITNKITLANNTTYDMSGWTYDYSTRTYTSTTVDNSTNITINYGDKNVTTNTVNNITGATETFNYNYVTVVEPPPPASSSTAPPPASSSTAPPPASSTVPPPASSGGGGSGGGSSGTDWLGTLLKSLLDGFLRLLNSVVGGVVDTIAGLVTKLVDGVTLIIDSLFKVMKQLLTFDSDFGKFLGAWFSWLPPEMVAILTGGLGLMVVLAVIRFMRKG